MNTEIVIQELCRAIETACPDRVPTFSLPDFMGFYTLHHSSIKTALAQGIPDTSELKSDAMMKIMVRASLGAVNKLGEAVWDKELVRRTYGTQVDGVDFIYYPCANPKRLVVNFSSMGKDRFDRYSRYWDTSQQWDSETAHLFFKDDDFTYFLGTDQKPKTTVYSRIIRQFQDANSLNLHQVYTVGGSMGGYGALYYALMLGLSGAIVCAPQINQRAMQAHAFNNWIRHARTTGSQWADLDLMVHRFAHIPYIYIEHGNYPADRLAVADFIGALDGRNTLLIHRHASWSEHTRDDVLQKDLVDSTILYFETSRQMEKTYSTIV